MIGLSARSRIMNGDETVILTRQGRTIGGGITWVAGRPVVDETLTQTISVRCNVQPVQGDDLQTLPDGQQDSDQFYLYCQKQAALPVIGDLFSRNGKMYQIMDADDWGAYVRARGINSQALTQLEGYEP
jgi:hypothetical protein